MVALHVELVFVIKIFIKGVDLLSNTKYQFKPGEYD